MILTVHRWFANKSCPGDWLYNRLGDLVAKVTAALGGTVQNPPTDNSVWYRVRKTWADSKSQIGAYHSLANAKACADKNTGYCVFDESGNIIYPVTNTLTKIINTLAREVIRGDWGNGAERKQKLTAAGYDYAAVQKRVNEMLK